MCQFCRSPYTAKTLVKNKPICGECAMAIWLTGKDPIIIDFKENK